MRKDNTDTTQIIAKPGEKEIMVDEKYLNKLKLYKLLNTVLAMARMSNDETAYEMLSLLKERRENYPVSSLTKRIHYLYKAVDPSFSKSEMREELYITEAIIINIICSKRRSRLPQPTRDFLMRYRLLSISRLKPKEDRLFPLPTKKYEDYLWTD